MEDDRELEDVEPVRRADYRTARIGAAGALVGLVVVLALIDAFSPAYVFSEITLGALLGAIVTLLGIEAASVIRGSRG